MNVSRAGVTNFERIEMYFDYDNTRDYSITARGGIWCNESLNNPRRLFICWKHKRIRLVQKDFVPPVPCDGEFIEIIPSVKKAESVPKIKIKSALMKMVGALEEE